jgi:hypothetical protein
MLGLLLNSLTLTKKEESMFTKSFKVISLAVIIAIMSSGCSPYIKNGSDQWRSWFDVQRKYAEALDKSIGTDKLYEIVPIMGPIYPIGTPITAGTSSPITLSCKIDTDALIKTDFQPVPITTEDRKFELSLGMSDSLKKTLKGIADLGVKVASTKTLEISYSELSQIVAPEDAIRQALGETNCLNAVKGHKIAFIRGLICGSMKAISDSKLEVDPTIKVANIGDFTVKYNAKGSFNLEDPKSDRPRFFIVSEIDVTTKLVRDNEINEIPVLNFSKPSQETLKELIADTR